MVPNSKVPIAAVPITYVAVAVTVERAKFGILGFKFINNSVKKKRNISFKISIVLFQRHKLSNL